MNIKTHIPEKELIAFADKMIDYSALQDVSETSHDDQIFNFAQRHNCQLPDVIEDLFNMIDNGTMEPSLFDVIASLSMDIQELIYGTDNIRRNHYKEQSIN